MKNVSPNFLADDCALDQEIDELFCQLEQFEPPATMVARIMDAVSHLPQRKPTTVWDNLAMLTVTIDFAQLS